ncbi:MAG TPA: potassium transporter, partial [Rhodanobacteraceae bacterium]|nr:potassium transporter [Rhodanobacteraceae bacterium]
MQQLHRRIGGQHWFPHVPLAILLALGGFWLLQGELGRHWRHILNQLLNGGQGLSPALLPPLLIGLGMLIMAFGLLFRSRLAWAMALLLAATAAISMYFAQYGHTHLLLGYFILMLALLG